MNAGSVEDEADVPVVSLVSTVVLAEGIAAARPRVAAARAVTMMVKVFILIVIG